MTTTIVIEELKRFLASDKSEVLCVKGRWGVGKTHTWDTALKAAVGCGQIGLKRYAYVSLFGQNSLDDLRYALFENSLSVSSVIEDNSGLHLPDFKELEKIGRNSLGFLKIVPALNSYLANANRSFFLLVRDQIICFDDLERAGKGLEAKDVLGLISFLKERRRCKVVLLLNEEALSDRAQSDFRTQLEKVADTILEFSPTSAEAAKIGFPDVNETTQQLRQCCESLGITNIRVMGKINRLIERLQPLLSDFDECVLKQAIPSITLFAWAIYQPDDAPKIDFITSYNRLAGFMSNDRKVENDEHKSWRSLLHNYDFSHMDAFDQVLLAGVKRGAFDSENVVKEAMVLDKQFKHQKLDNSFSQAWAFYHDSFDQNTEAVLDGLFASFEKSVQVISISNLNSTIKIFKDLGRPEQAKELLDCFMRNREEPLSFFDLEHRPFESDIDDPDLKRAFADRVGASLKHFNIHDVLLKIAKMEGWSPDDFDFLAACATDDYVNLFKQLRGDDLRRAISGALYFQRLSNASPQMKDVAAKATEALKQIARESPINARRVLRTYGVSLDDPMENES